MVAYICRDQTLFLQENAWFCFSNCLLTSARYADVLQNHIQPNLEPTLADKHKQGGMTFMQDGVLPHIVTRVKDLLRISFAENPILSIRFHYACPLRSPCLNLRDY
ncbi:hypothetical protein TNCV_430781 [Trichonephila clavipes]|nr:hypothetical protein TNCV_430781 [Trichonephila clavipes]